MVQIGTARIGVKGEEGVGIPVEWCIYELQAFM